MASTNDGAADAPQCRICFAAANEDDPLISPCACKGSLEFVHASCLDKWRRVMPRRRQNTCETCRTRYTCAPPPGAPRKHPARDMAAAIVGFGTTVWLLWKLPAVVLSVCARQGGVALVSKKGRVLPHARDVLAQIFARFDGDESGELDLAELRDLALATGDTRGENEAVLRDAVMRHHSGARGDEPRGLTLGGLDIAYAAMGSTALFKDVKALGLLDALAESVSGDLANLGHLFLEGPLVTVLTGMCGLGCYMMITTIIDGAGDAIRDAQQFDGL